MTSKFLQVLRPFMSITPEVMKPKKEVKFNEKVLWTFGALVIYFIMSSLPIFGTATQGTSDPFEFLRTIMASNRGTLAELGIGPIVTAGLILQILVGSKIINVDMGDPEERSLYTGAQKVLSVFMTIFEGGAYIIGGAYGPMGQLGNQAILLIMTQLLAAGIAIILLDEMIQKGWGLGSGISLFIAGGVATQIFWHAFYFSQANVPDEHPLGTITAFISLALDPNYGLLGAIGQLTFRPQLPTGSLIAIGATIVVFLVVIYFESMRVEIPVSYAEHRGFRGKYPIKLLYTSNIPVILVSAVFADLYFIAQMLWNVDKGNILVQILGQFTTNNTTQKIEPTGGLVYFLTPPRGIFGYGAVIPTLELSPNVIDFAALTSSLPRAAIYALAMIVLSVFFSRMWIETAGMGPKDVSKQLLDAGMQIPGWRRSKKTIEKRLEMYIPAAAMLGGLFIGVLAAFADFLGALGTGTGILLSVSIMRQYFDILVKERAAEMHPAIRDFLGII
jgi:protein transport protein SEC61 subunit alpha